MMSRIYKGCLFTLVWLGAEFAVRQNPETDQGQMFNGSDILASEYFDRLWIVQEVSLAPRVNSFYDHECIAWKKVRLHVFK